MLEKLKVARLAY